MGPLDKYILADDALRSHATGFRLAVQSHWYRSLPLSCMQFNLLINGQPVAAEAMDVMANGKVFSMSQLPALYNEFLFVTDKAVLAVTQAPLKQGDTYAVELTYTLLLPYILIGPAEQPLLAASTVTKRLVCQ